MKYSAQHLEDITIRILNAGGQPVGAGFLITEMLAVTCAHVINDAKSEPGDEVTIEFYKGEIKTVSKVSADYWSDQKEDDVAFLLLPQNQDTRKIVPIRHPIDTIGHEFAALGFRNMGDRKGLYAQGKLAGTIPVGINRHPLLQMEGNDIYEGMSGAAVFDLDAGVIVGMVSEYIPTTRGPQYAYATTIETIKFVHPALQEIVDDIPNVSIYIDELTERLEAIGNAYQSWGYDMKGVVQLDQLGIQLQSTYDAIHLEIQKYPDYRSKLAIEGLLQKSKDDFHKLKGAFLYSTLNSSNDERIEGEIQRSLAVHTDSVKRLIELIT